MRAANATLQAFLASRQPYIVADLFKFTLNNGTIYTWTSYDEDLLVGGFTYSALGPLIDRTKFGVKNTIEVPEMEIKIFSSGADLPDGSNLKLLVHNGLFDYSSILLSRLFMATPGDTTLGAVDIFSGNAASVDIDALSITVTVKGANVMLEQYMPRNRFTLGCTHALFDGNCAPNPGASGGGPSRAANTNSNSVGAGSTRSAINFGAAAPPTPGNLALGYITFTSGTSAGIKRTISGASSAGVTLSYPLYETPAEGDTFTVTYGCDHTRGANGCAFFNNLVHFRGFPWVPPATYAL